MNGSKAKRLRKETGVPHPGRKYGGTIGIAQDAKPNSIRRMKRKLAVRKTGKKLGDPDAG